jgi:L-seryl-tRNA(Ser) seleniumtransferase
MQVVAKKGAKIPSKAELYRRLPAVDELLRRAELAPLISGEGQAAVADAARSVLAHLRREISARRLDEAGLEIALSGVVAAVERELGEELGYSLRPVINATGVILHTNLGRAPLAASALAHINETAAAYSNLEFDLAAAERGKRDVHVDRLFRKLLHHSANGGTGVLARAAAEISTIVVNNNAAALLLAVNTLAEAGEVLVSRGELIEIGESFRLPDILSKSSAILQEVGTTNRTRLADYERAINAKTRLLLRVHRSNFQITGFTEQPSLDELVALARRRNVPLMQDLGSGALLDLESLGVKGEPTVLDSLRSGVDVVIYSGDKLLGGPQTGMLSGRSDLIARMRANPLFRALRVDKLTYAALEATLLVYVKQDYDAIPTLRMLRASKQEIGTRAEALAAKIQSAPVVLELLDGESVIGGGAAPSSVLPTRLLALRCEGLSAEEISARLRAADPPILTRLEEGRVLFDLRTVFPEQDEALMRTLRQMVSS